MMPRTVHNMDALVCISTMQKNIRRSMEREAMEHACELLHSSNAFHTMVLNRLETIAHEDVDVIAAPHVVPFVAAAVAQSKARYGRHIGEARLIVGNIIRLLCRAPKSRAGCHFAAAIGLRSLLRTTRRQFLTGPTISTRSKVASWGAVSITFARKVRG